MSRYVSVRSPGDMLFLKVVLALLIFAVGRAYPSFEGRESDPNAGQQSVNAEFLRRGSSSHTDNWAVLVCTSRFWFNYRYHLLLPLSSLTLAICMAGEK